VALVANEELIDALTLFITLVNVFPSPLVNVIVSLLLDAVRTLFNANDAVEANDELVVVFDVVANDAEIAFCASEADVANDELIACEADTACEAEVAKDAETDVAAKSANEALTALDELIDAVTLFIVVLNVVPLPFV
jgi:hypothetical protein